MRRRAKAEDSGGLVKPRGGDATDPLRRTGRTTRMLDAARAAADRGESVLVLVANHREVQRVRGLLHDHPQIIVRHYDAPLIGFRATTFVDHYVHEQAPLSNDVRCNMDIRGDVPDPSAHHREAAVRRAEKAR